MKTFFLILLSAISLPAVAADRSSPFALSIVPETQSATTASISVGADSKRPFYVVLTNRTEIPQPIFEYWNLWGYQTISFDLTLPNKQVVHLAKRGQIFTRNFPSTYVIFPHRQQVFPITLDQSWEGLPAFNGAGGITVGLRAIYTVAPTPESKAKGVWEGTVDSDPITAYLRYSGKN